MVGARDPTLRQAQGLELVETARHCGVLAFVARTLRIRTLIRVAVGTSAATYLVVD